MALEKWLFDIKVKKGKYSNYSIHLNWGRSLSFFLVSWWWMIILASSVSVRIKPKHPWTERNLIQPHLQRPKLSPSGSCGGKNVRLRLFDSLRHSCGAPVSPSAGCQGRSLYSGAQRSQWSPAVLCLHTHFPWTWEREEERRSSLATRRKRGREGRMGGTKRSVWWRGKFPREDEPVLWIYLQFFFSGFFLSSSDIPTSSHPITLSLSLSYSLAWN